MRTLLILLSFALQAICSDYPPPRELFTLSWTGGPLTWPSAVVRSMYKTTGKFEPRNIIGTRAIIFRNDVFVTFPRFLSGVPVTLARTPLLSTTGEPAFEPFPSWEAQAEGDPQALQNAMDIFLDSKDVLWVLDTGVTRTLESPAKQCGPRVFGFDPVTGKQLYKVDLSGLTTATSRLQYVVADTDAQDHPFLYIADAGDRALLVYNLATETGYRVMLPESMVDGCHGGRGDVLYMTLAKPKTGGRRLYLTYLCSKDFYSVRTQDLQAGTDQAVEKVISSKPQRMVIIGTDGRGTIYFRYEGKGDILAWDVNSDLTEENFKTVHRGDGLLLATQAVLDPLRSKVRILESNFLDFLRHTAGMGAVHVLRAIS